MDNLISDTRLIRPAKIITQVFSPFYAPIWALLWLLFFSTYKMFRIEYRLNILFIVVIFTVVIPKITLYIFRKAQNLSKWMFDLRENRHIQYVVTLLSYITCVILFTRIQAPDFFRCVLIAGVIAEIVCFIINIWWKISVHLVSIGGLVGIVSAFSHRFGFEPVTPICVIIFIGGLVGSCQMFMRQHSLVQVLVGFFLGIVCSWIAFTFW